MKTVIIISLSICSILAGCTSNKSLDKPKPENLSAQTPELDPVTKSQPEELGIVNWSRDLDLAKQVSKESGKPLLILFNEVPGCNTVIGFGKGALSDRKVKGIIETQFVPVYVQNNTGGKDAEILKQYGEPAWNNPIVRIYDPRGNEIATRFSGPYTTDNFTNHLNQTIDDNGGPIANLKDAKTLTPEKATFAMYCFWTGEAKFGDIDGVLETRPGFQNGHEVVEVTYDSAIIDYESLANIAADKGIADVAIVESKKQFLSAKKAFKSVEQKQSDMRFSKKDDKYYLNRSSYKDMNLTPFQSTKINSALKTGKDPDQYLTKKK